MTERPIPAPGKEQVVVRLRAASLNYRDLIHLENKAGRDVEGIIPLSDGAGVVHTVGPGVEGFASGDRVMANFFLAWRSGRFSMAYHSSALGGPGQDGMLTEYAVVPASALLSIPDYLSFEEAACLPCAALTAWQALVVRGNVQKGDSILVLGTGGVSIFAVQIGVAMGCKVYVTSSSDEKLKQVRDLGTSGTVNYKTIADWEKEIHRLTERKGVDHVIEVGGAGTLSKSMACVAAGGHIALIGVLTGFGPPDSSLFPIVSKNASMSGIYVGSSEQFAQMLSFFQSKGIHPVLDRVFEFEESPEALEYFASGSHVGKIVIRIS